MNSRGDVTYLFKRLAKLHNGRSSAMFFAVALTDPGLSQIYSAAVMAIGLHRCGNIDASRIMFQKIAQYDSRLCYLFDQYESKENERDLLERLHEPTPDVVAKLVSSHCRKYNILNSEDILGVCKQLAIDRLLSTSDLVKVLTLYIDKNYSSMAYGRIRFVSKILSSQRTV